MQTIGIDLGGTNIKAALVGDGGRILRQMSCPTALPRPAEAICEDILGLCQELIRQADGPVTGVGLGCPGTVDADAGMVLYANNLGWELFPIGRILRQRLGLPVALANDANAAAYGEAVAGCAQNAQSAVILTLGTGVGGGVILDGRLLTGYTGGAAEPGHIIIQQGGEACTCGCRGCLEAYASATALIRQTQRAMQQNPQSLMHAIAGQGPVTGRTAFDAAAAGDAAAQQVVDTYIQYLAVGVASLINLFFPEVVGLSGGVANQGEALLEPLRRAVEPMVYGHAFCQKHTRIVGCSLGYQAGLVGAAFLAREQA